MTNKLKIAIRLILVILSLTLSGCIKTTTSITVQPDGSGEIITSLGFPIELVAEMTLRGVDPVKDLKKILFADMSHGTIFDQTNDSTHEWLMITRPFTSLDDLNNLLQQQDFVESSTFQRNRGFLQDQFALDAQISLSNFVDPFEYTVVEEGKDSLATDNQLPDVQVSIQLPGKIIETNGLLDASTQAITWSTDSDASINLHALTEMSNTSNLAVTAGLAILGVALLVAIVLLVIRSRRKSQPGVEDANVRQRLVASVHPVEEEELPESEPEPEKEEVFPPSKILAMIGARELLDQVNHHVLHNRGEISVAKGAIRLVWSDQEDTSVTRGIMITVQDTETIVINGVPFPAKREAAREGLISCLKGLTRQQ